MFWVPQIMGRTKKSARTVPKPPDRSKWPPTFTLGWFTAGNVCLEEAAINDVVLRVLVRRSSVKQEVKPQGRPQKTVKAPEVRKRKKAKFMDGKGGVNELKTLINNRVKQVLRNGQRRHILPKSGAKRGFSLKYLAHVIDKVHLPTSQWKVTVVMNQDMSTVCVFSYNMGEKSVTISDSKPFYSILMQEKPVVLLGAPKMLNSIRDVEILLDIVDRLDLRDCMVL